MTTPNAPPDTHKSILLAARIEDYVRRRKETEPGFSVRRLSSLAGLGPSQLGATLVRLKGGGSVRADLLDGLAAAMQTTAGELLGEERSAEIAPTFGELPGWATAVVEATSRFDLRAEGLSAIAKWRPHAAPKALDGASVVAIYRAWETLPRR